MNPKISRRAVAQAIAAKLVAEPQRRSHWIQILAGYIVDQKLTDSIDLIANDLVREIFALNGELLVQVTTARPLQDAARTELRTMLRNALDAKHIELQEETDAEVLGGFIVRTPDAIMDASVRTKLKQLASI